LVGFTAASVTSSGSWVKSGRTRAVGRRTSRSLGASRRKTEGTPEAVHTRDSERMRSQTRILSLCSNVKALVQPTFRLMTRCLGKQVFSRRMGLGKVWGGCGKGQGGRWYLDLPELGNDHSGPTESLRETPGVDPAVTIHEQQGWRAVHEHNHLLEDSLYWNVQEARPPAHYGDRRGEREEREKFIFGVRWPLRGPDKRDTDLLQMWS